MRGNRHIRLHSTALRLRIGIKFRTLAMLGLKNIESAVIAIAGVELLRRIHKNQFALGQLKIKGQAAPAIWNANPTA